MFFGKRRMPKPLLEQPSGNDSADGAIPTCLHRTAKGFGSKPRSNMLSQLLKIMAFALIKFDGVAYAMANQVTGDRSGTDKGCHWCLDSGASGHFCSDISKFKTLRTAGPKRYVRVANGQRILAGSDDPVF